MKSTVNSFEDEFGSIDELEEALSRPAPELVEMMHSLEGDFLFLGVSGKMGISMACMAKRACEQAGVNKRILGVSRFSDTANQNYLEAHGIETMAGDLLDQELLNKLPDFSNVVYLAGTKFGTQGNEAFTWVMNAYLPGLVAERFKSSRIVALSTGCVYPLVDVGSRGSLETDKPGPVGEYAQSCLGRERLFESGSKTHGTSVALIRLNYSVEMRYGVLVDIASKVDNAEPVDVSMGHANVIWQGDANNAILQSFQFCSSPAKHINITGPETVSIRDLANRFGEILNKKAIIVGEEQNTALLSDASWMFKELGHPSIQLEQVIEWTGKWIRSGRSILGKPTHFEVRDGKY